MKKHLVFFLMATLMMVACKNEKKESEATALETNTEETMKEANDWEVLFDGSSLDQWRGYLSDSMYSEWTIDGDAMKFTPGEQGGKNIISNSFYVLFFNYSMQFNRTCTIFIA